MQVIHSPITLQSIKDIAADRFGDLVKCVVDTEKQIQTIVSMLITP